MTEQALMQQIFDKYHLVLASAVAGSTVLSESFLAALVANESGGDHTAQRFEPTVFVALADVMVGKKAAYAPAGIAHPLGAQDFLALVDPGFINGLRRLQALATSWGLTQIMGWHAVEMGKSTASALSTTPADQIAFTIELLTYFANRYTLHMGTDFEAMLRCWNAGKPDGKTYDPRYVPNALARMDIYAAIVAKAAAPLVA